MMRNELFEVWKRYMGFARQALSRCEAGKSLSYADLHALEWYRGHLESRCWNVNGKPLRSDIRERLIEELEEVSEILKEAS